MSTTDPGGAGKFRSEFGPILAGRRVIALEDNDQPGHDLVADVLRKVRRHAASSAALLLPNLPDKGDVSDWLDAGGTLAELVKLAEAALVSPQTAGKPNRPWQTIDAAALDAMQFPPIKYIVPSILPEGLTLLAGKPKFGKSYLALALASRWRAVASHSARSRWKPARCSMLRWRTTRVGCNPGRARCYRSAW